MNINLFRNLILFEEIKEARKTGGLEVPESSKKNIKCRIINVGYEIDPSLFQIDSIVMVKKSELDEIEIDDVKYLVGEDKSVILTLNA